MPSTSTAIRHSFCSCRSVRPPTSAVRCPCCELHSGFNLEIAGGVSTNPYFPFEASFRAFPSSLRFFSVQMVWHYLKADVLPVASCQLCFFFFFFLFCRVCDQIYNWNNLLPLNLSCYCWSHTNSSLQCSPWSQDRVQKLWSGRLHQGGTKKTEDTITEKNRIPQTKIKHARSAYVGMKIRIISHA